MSKDDRRRYLQSLRGVQRISYFWYYYKWHALAVIFVLASAVSLYVLASRIDQNALNVVITDDYSAGIDTELLTECFSAAAGAPRTAEYDITMALNTSEQLQITLVNGQKLTAMNSARHLDVLLAPEAVFEKYASRGLFYSLDGLLPEHTVERLSVDGKIVSGQLDSALNPEGITGHENGRVLAGIRISDAPLVSQAGIEVEDLCIGVPASSVRKEDALIFLQMFLEPYGEQS